MIGSVNEIGQEFLTKETEREREISRVSIAIRSTNDMLRILYSLDTEEDVAKVGALWAILFSVTV